MNLLQRYQNGISWVDEIDRLFDRSLRTFAAAVPLTRESLHESDEAWILRLDLPGFTKEDFKLEVVDRNLGLTAETPEDRPFGGKFERQWKLGNDVDTANITAQLENGVLELRLPKITPVAVEPKTIEIK